MVWFKEDLKDHPDQPMPWQRHLPLSQVDPNRIQPGLGYSRDPGAATVGVGAKDSKGFQPFGLWGNSTAASVKEEKGKFGL